MALVFSGQHTWMRGTLVRSTVPSVSCNTLTFLDKGMVIIRRIETIRSRAGCPQGMLAGSTLAKVWVLGCYGTLRLKVRATPTREGDPDYWKCKPRIRISSVILTARYHGTGLWRPSVHSDVAF